MSFVPPKAIGPRARGSRADAATLGVATSKIVLTVPRFFWTPIQIFRRQRSTAKFVGKVSAKQKGFISSVPSPTPPDVQVLVACGPRSQQRRSPVPRFVTDVFLRRFMHNTRLPSPASRPGRDSNKLRNSSHKPIGSIASAPPPEQRQQC